MCGKKFPNISDLNEHCKISHPPPGFNKPIAKTSPTLAQVSDQLTSLIPSSVSMTTESLHRNSANVTSFSSGQQISEADAAIKAITHPHLPTEVSVTMVTAEQISTPFNFETENILHSDSDPKLQVVSMETVSADVVGSTIIDTGSHSVHTEAPESSSFAEQCNMVDTTTTGVENTHFNETVIYLTEPLSGINPNTVLCTESSEFGTLPVPLVSTISSDISIAEPLSHPTVGEHHHFDEERDQTTVSNLTVDNIDIVNNPTHYSVTIATQSDMDESQTSCINSSAIFVPVSEEGFVAMETESSEASVPEAVDFIEHKVIDPEEKAKLQYTEIEEQSDSVIAEVGCTGGDETDTGYETKETCEQFVTTTDRNTVELETNNLYDRNATDSDMTTHTDLGVIVPDTKNTGDTEGLKISDNSDSGNEVRTVTNDMSAVQEIHN